MEEDDPLALIELDFGHVDSWELLVMFAFIVRAAHLFHDHTPKVKNDANILHSSIIHLLLRLANAPLTGMLLQLESAPSLLLLTTEMKVKCHSRQHARRVPETRSARPAGRA